ncbi:MAG: hypothetical protein LUD01_03585, partial [Clostridiales bacterium]|nr:hypothetical protein [Clostridiales bacterium]
MGFYIANREQKQRINLSHKAWLVMQEDMSVFGTDGKATFINRVIENFHDLAKASCDHYLRNLEKDMIRLYADGGLDDEARDAAVRIYLDRERNRLMEAVKEQSRNKAHTALYRINNANAEYLSGEECSEDRFYGDCHPSNYSRVLPSDYFTAV